MENQKVIWTPSEINTLLDIMIEEKLMKLLDDKKTRNKEIYKLIKTKLEEFGYKRDEDQIKSKFQKLKTQFLRVNSNNNRSGCKRMDNSFYEKMQTLIKDRPASCFKHTGYESRVENTPTSPEIELNAIDNIEDIIIEEDIDENENIPPTPPRSSKKNNKSYQSIVKTMTKDITKAIKEETDKVISSLHEMQNQDHQFLREIQSNDQSLILQLFGLPNTPPQPVYYCVERADQ